MYRSIQLPSASAAKKASTVGDWYLAGSKVFRDKVPELLRILCSFLLRFWVDIVQFIISIRFCLDSKVISAPCLLL